MINSLYIVIWGVFVFPLLFLGTGTLYTLFEEARNMNENKADFKNYLKLMLSKMKVSKMTIIAFIVSALTILLVYGISARIKCKINPDEIITNYNEDPISFSTLERINKNGVHYRINDVGVLYDEETNLSLKRNVQLVSINLIWLIYLIAIFGTYFLFLILVYIYCKKLDIVKELPQDKYDKCLNIHCQLSWFAFFFGILGIFNLQLIFNMFAEWMLNL